MNFPTTPSDLNNGTTEDKDWVATQEQALQIIGAATQATNAAVLSLATTSDEPLTRYRPLNLYKALKAATAAKEQLAWLQDQLVFIFSYKMSNPEVDQAALDKYFDSEYSPTLSIYIRALEKNLTAAIEMLQNKISQCYHERFPNVQS